MKRILITGGAGFIGSNLALHLIKEQFEVTVLDNLSEQIHGSDPIKTSPLFKSIFGKISFVKEDIRNAKVLEELVSRHEVIIHFAAETGTGQSMYDISHYTEVNVQATAMLLDILTNKSHSIQRIILASSRSIYGEGRYWSTEKGYVFPGPRKDEDLQRGFFEPTFIGCTNLSPVATDEDSKLHPLSVYGATKLAQENLVTSVCQAIGITSVVLRFQNVYGPGQSLSNPYTGILSIFSNCILNDTEINIFEDGLESRDFIFIEDVIKATFMGITSPNANNQIFNVGSGIATTVLDVAYLLTNLYNKPADIKITGNYRLGDIRHNYADISLINKQLGFNCSVTIEEGMKKFSNWVQTQELYESGYENSLDKLKKKGLFK